MSRAFEEGLSSVLLKASHAYGGFMRDVRKCRRSECGSTRSVELFTIVDNGTNALLVYLCEACRINWMTDGSVRDMRIKAAADEGRYQAYHASLIAGGKTSDGGAYTASERLGNLRAEIVRQDHQLIDYAVRFLGPAPDEPDGENEDDVLR